MKLRSALLVCVAVAGVLVPFGASAHILNEAGGWTAGISHPLFGPDHLLAMLAVGFWAAQMGGRAMWAVPLTFVSIMGGGARHRRWLELPSAVGRVRRGRVGPRIGIAGRVCHPASRLRRA